MLKTTKLKSKGASQPHHISKRKILRHPKSQSQQSTSQLNRCGEKSPSGSAPQQQSRLSSQYRTFSESIPQRSPIRTRSHATVTINKQVPMATSISTARSRFAPTLFAHRNFNPTNPARINMSRFSSTRNLSTGKGNELLKKQRKERNIETILESLQIKHPIFVAPMAGVSTPELAAEVSNTGAFGSLGLGANTPETAKAEILKTQKLTDRPFQVNFFCHQPERLDEHKAQKWIEYVRPQFAKFGAEPATKLRCIYPSFLSNDDFLNVVLETQPKAVSFHFGIPHPHQVQALKNAGIITMVSATNLIEAKQIEAAGIDIIIAQGIEAGGHRGIFNKTFDASIGTSYLVQLVSEHCKVPVVAAGGIMNGDQANSMINQGASAVQLGTAFVQCKSSNANAAYRKALFSNDVTQISASLSGRTARGLLGAWHTLIDAPNRPEVPEYPYTYDLTKQLISLASQHNDFSYGSFWAGMNVGQIRELEAPELIDQLVLEMKTNSNNSNQEKSRSVEHLVPNH